MGMKSVLHKPRKQTMLLILCTNSEVRVKLKMKKRYKGMSITYYLHKLICSIKI